MVEIDGARLLADLNSLRSFGASGTGVIRPTFSEADMAAREWLRDKMTAVGLSAEIDGVGNVFGRSPNPGPALIIGSHSDTQPQGGWLDGAMGVIYAIEIARALSENDSTSVMAIDTVAWSDEEGTYTSCLGSKAFVGTLNGDDLACTKPTGESVTDAIERVGLSASPRAMIDPKRHVGYLEAHIEQGPHLEDTQMRIGVVTSIVGIRSFKISFAGQQNHAGTTPMARRKDAAVAMFDFAVDLRERLSNAAGFTSVWTMGDVRVEPGAESIVPGYAELTLQFRDSSDLILDAMARAVADLATAHNTTSPVEIAAMPGRDPIAPTTMAAKLRAHIATAAELVAPGCWVEMPSAAGHDPMVLSDHVPCAMLFVPSIGGISHDFAENSHDEDIVLGCRVLANAAATILSDAR